MNFGAPFCNLVQGDLQPLGNDIALTEENLTRAPSMEIQSPSAIGVPSMEARCVSGSTCKPAQPTTQALPI